MKDACYRTLGNMMSNISTEDREQENFPDGTERRYDATIDEKRSMLFDPLAMLFKEKACREGGWEPWKLRLVLVA